MLEYGPPLVQRQGHADLLPYLAIAEQGRELRPFACIGGWPLAQHVQHTLQRPLIGDALLESERAAVVGHNARRPRIRSGFCCAGERKKLPQEEGGETDGLQTAMRYLDHFFLHRQGTLEGDFHPAAENTLNWARLNGLGNGWEV